MMEELRFAFLLIGSLFIVAVLFHGIWKMRKQNAAKEAKHTPTNQRIEPTTSEDDDQGFDELGIGSVRVLSEPMTAPEKGTTQSEYSDEDNLVSVSSQEPDIFAGNSPAREMRSDEEVGVQQTSTEKQEIIEDEAANEQVTPETLPMYASVVTQPKPHLSTSRPKAEETDDAIPEPPGFLLREESTAPAAPVKTDEAEKMSNVDAEPDFGLSAISQPEPQAKPPAEKKAESTATSARPMRKRASSRKRKEPTLGIDQMRIDFDEPSVQPANKEPEQRSDTPAAQPQEQEVLILNVRTDEDNPLSGAALLPMLLTLGFKFGDQDIFHRHVNANGKGPVLFSLANMIKPGVFDIDNLENFTTPGISLFMVLPIEGDPHQVFNMMHNAARKIADEFNAQVLDGRRSVLTKQGLQRYVEKIREFERQRIIARSTH